MIARRGHPAPAAPPPSRDGYIQRLLSRNFPGTASCDRTRSGASTATRGQPGADAPSHRPLSRRDKRSPKAFYPPTHTHPAGPTLRPTRGGRSAENQIFASDVTNRGRHGRRERKLTSGTCDSGDLLQSTGTYLLISLGIFRISSLGCSKGATVCQECQLGHL